MLTLLNEILISDKNWIWIQNVRDIDFQVISIVENSTNVSSYTKNSPWKLFRFTTEVS